MNLQQEKWWVDAQSDDNAIILDVRTPEEFERGVIPKAINIDIYKGQGFIYMLEELDKSKSYYVYCHAGSRSAKACQVMQQLGFEKTYNLSGGISEWDGPVVEPN
ncbi:rhodanese-like domain-containing protein [Flavobacterium orientale]|uniref:Rhodanese n=1 Tax=Flavobacterium orientale TaxID=1756020 RepID=A0A916Y6E6_9FLAO|nr:rhodanese-like domain-containing protein [Flavobacterium orientale]GGD31189.1 rhodanese [Flavobacterium orientale]